MLYQCWASVEDGGPTLKQHWANAPCFLKYDIHHCAHGGWPRWLIRFGCGSKLKGTGFETVQIPPMCSVVYNTVH